jgi:hypothetical protein
VKTPNSWCENFSLTDEKRDEANISDNVLQSSTITGCRGSKQCSQHINTARMKFSSSVSENN